MFEFSADYTCAVQAREGKSPTFLGIPLPFNFGTILAIVSCKALEPVCLQKGDHLRPYEASDNLLLAEFHPDCWSRDTKDLRQG